MQNIFTNALSRAIILLLLFCSTSSVYAHWGSKGPYGGSVSASITIDTNVYVGTYTGGVFRSANKSLLSWTVRNNGLGSGKITCFTNIGTVVYAGTADDGVYKSTDIGSTWTKVSTGLHLQVTALTASGTTLIAGTDGGGVFISTNDGATWTAANTGLGSLNVTALALSGTTLYVGTDNGVFVSTLAASWTAANSNLTELYINSLVVNSTMIYAGTDAGIFSSPQASISWTLENTGLNTVEITGLYSANGILYAGTFSGLYTSSDAAALSWSAENTGGLADDTVTAITYYNNKLIVGTYDQGIFKSNLTPISWSAFNTGFNNLNVRTFFAENSLIISATNWGLFVSRDIAASYVRANNGLTDSLFVNSLLFVGTTLYAGTEHHGVFVSADTGRTWSTANTGLTNLNVQYILAYNTQLITVSRTGVVYTSSASAISWTPVPAAFPSSQAVTAIVTNGVSLYVSTRGDGVFKFNGVSWSTVNTGLTHTVVTDLTIHGTAIFASTIGGGVFSSPLSSISWTAVNSGLPAMDVYSLGTLNQYVIVGLKGMVYATYDEGQSWLPTNVQLNLPSFSELSGIGFTSSRVFVSTPDNSLYSNATSELPMDPTTPVIPAIGSGASGHEVLLYPNPGQGEFNIAFLKTDESLQKVTISTNTGVVLQEASAVEQLQKLDKGIYIITIVTNKGVSIQKLIVQ